MSTDEFAAYDAVFVDGICFRPHVSVEEIGGALLGVADGDHVHVVAGNEVAVIFFVLVDADGDDGDIGIPALKLNE